MPPFLPCAWLKRWNRWAPRGSVALTAGTSYLDPASVGTFAVAAVTLVLAVATLRQVLLSQHALDLSIRPMLAEPEPRVDAAPEDVRFGAPGRWAVPLRPDEFYLRVEDGVFAVSVPFRNVGAGVAVITSAGTLPGAPGDVVFSRKFVRPGEHVRVNVSVLVASDEARALLDAWATRLSFCVTVGCHDADGEQALVSRADIHGFSTHEPFVRQIAIRRAGESQPFLMSGPSDG